MQVTILAEKIVSFMRKYNTKDSYVMASIDGSGCHIGRIKDVCMDANDDLIITIDIDKHSTTTPIAKINNGKTLDDIEYEASIYFQTLTKDVALYSNLCRQTKKLIREAYELGIKHSNK